MTMDATMRADGVDGIDDGALLSQAAADFGRLRQAVTRTVLGQDDAVDALMTALLADGHTLIVGVPGLAKTLLVHSLADALGWSFNRIQFTPDMMPGDLLGTEVLDEDPTTQRRSLRFVKGPVFANLILADEINRTPPKTQSALLEAMQERTVTTLGQTHTLERPFLVVATQNPIEQEGTYPLPEAQLDRFMFSLFLDYPSEQDEQRIVLETTSANVAQKQAIEPVMDRQTMLQYQALARRVPVTSSVAGYAVRIARATRPDDATAHEAARQYLRYGAGTRAAQAMILAGKALAVMTGEPAVACEHVRLAATHVLRHRLLANYQAAADGVDALEVVKRVVHDVREA